MSSGLNPCAQPFLPVAKRQPPPQVVQYNGVQHFPAPAPFPPPQICACQGALANTVQENNSLLKVAIERLNTLDRNGQQFVTSVNSQVKNLKLSMLHTQNLFGCPKEVPNGRTLATYAQLRQDMSRLESLVNGLAQQRADAEDRKEDGLLGAAPAEIHEPPQPFAYFVPTGPAYIHWQ